jgi:hypothetical protein
MFGTIALMRGMTIAFLMLVTIALMIALVGLAGSC